MATEWSSRSWMQWENVSEVVSSPSLCDQSALHSFNIASHSCPTHPAWQLSSCHPPSDNGSPPPPPPRPSPHIPLSLSIRVCRCMCVDMFVGYCSSVIIHLVFEASSLTGLKLTKQTRLAGQEVPEICLSFPPLLWIISIWHHTRPITRFLGDQIQVDPCACNGKSLPISLSSSPNTVVLNCSCKLELHTEFMFPVLRLYSRPAKAESLGMGLRCLPPKTWSCISYFSVGMIKHWPKLTYGRVYLG